MKPSDNCAYKGEFHACEKCEVSSVSIYPMISKFPTPHTPLPGETPDLFIVYIVPNCGIFHRYEEYSTIQETTMGISKLMSELYSGTFRCENCGANLSYDQYQKGTGMCQNCLRS